MSIVNIVRTYISHGSYVLFLATVNRAVRSSLFRFDFRSRFFGVGSGLVPVPDSICFVFSFLFVWIWSVECDVAL